MSFNTTTYDLTLSKHKLTVNSHLYSEFATSLIIYPANTQHNISYLSANSSTWSTRCCWLNILLSNSLQYSFSSQYRSSFSSGRLRQFFRTVSSFRLGSRHWLSTLGSRSSDMTCRMLSRCSVLSSRPFSINAVIVRTMFSFTNCSENRNACVLTIMLTSSLSRCAQLELNKLALPGEENDLRAPVRTYGNA